jgi:hypothetical protein
MSTVRIAFARLHSVPRAGELAGRFRDFGFSWLGSWRTVRRGQAQRTSFFLLI